MGFIVWSIMVALGEMTTRSFLPSTPQLVQTHAVQSIAESLRSMW